MKRFGNLYPQIVDFPNLLLAAKQTQKGKRYNKVTLTIIEGQLD